jgi:hypothetical protein
VADDEQQPDSPDNFEPDQEPSNAWIWIILVLLILIVLFFVFGGNSFFEGPKTIVPGSG